MPKPRNETLHGFLIHSCPVGEHRYLAWVFSAEQGIIRFLANGEEPPEKARLAVWSVRQRDQNSNLLEYRFSGPLLLQTPAAQYLALYVHELIYRLAPVGVGDVDLFQSFSECLVNLNYPERQVMALRRLESDLLLALGQSIDFQVDSELRPIDTHGRYTFIAQQGFTWDPQGRYTGLQIFAGARLDARVEGVLSLIRECHAAQLDALLSTQPMVSRSWQKRQTKKGER